MPREANAIDFWRGFALVSIFINHIPGIWYERLTHRNLSISDSAELFVFLAGWSLGLLVGSSEAAEEHRRVLVFRLGGRALQIYAAQILISSLALAMLAAAAYLLDNPLILEWHNAAAFFQDPAHRADRPRAAHASARLLRHPAAVRRADAGGACCCAHRPVRPAAARAALARALFRRRSRCRSRRRPGRCAGQWFFNPFTWQAIFVLGFALSRDEGLGAVVRRNIRLIRLCRRCRSWWSAPSLVLFNWFPDPTKLPEPQAAVPQRQELPDADAPDAVSGAGGGVLGGLPSYCAGVPWLPEFLSILGRNSLNVFCVGSLLSLAGQIVRFLYSGSLAVDTIVVIVGIGLLVADGMDVGMERATSSQLIVGTRAALVAAVRRCCAHGAWAQCAQHAATPEPPAVAKECGEAGVSDTPLPNSASALQQRKKIKILAIGASSAAVLRHGRDGNAAAARADPGAHHQGPRRRDHQPRLFRRAGRGCRRAPQDRGGAQSSRHRALAGRHQRCLRPGARRERSSFRSATRCAGSRRTTSM